MLKSCDSAAKTYFSADCYSTCVISRSFNLTFSKSFILVGVTAKQEPILKILVMRWEYTLDETTGHHRALHTNRFTPKVNLSYIIHWCVVGRWRKPDNLKEKPRHTENMHRTSTQTVTQAHVRTESHGSMRRSL